MKTLLISAALRQTADGASAAADGDDTERKSIAKREWIAPDGTVCESEHDASGMRYVYRADGKSYEWSPGVMQAADGTWVPDHATRMLSIFGGLTLAGNVTNTWKTKDNDFASPVDAIKARWDLLTTGQWIDRSESGARIDKDVLAESLIQLAIAAGKVDGADEAAVGTKKAEYREKLEDADYVRTVRKVPQVNAKYAELVGATVKTLDDVL